MDVFSRRIVGWALSDSIRTEALPLQALNQAIVCAEETAGLFHHSDPVSYTHLDVYKRQVDALAYQADEGRERLRYASGSCQLSVDPRMSEWGNPAAVMCGYLPVNI